MILINALCKTHQAKVDRIFMELKYTEPGSAEQHQSLKTLNNRMVQWVRFLATKEKES